MLTKQRIATHGIPLIILGLAVSACGSDSDEQAGLDAGTTVDSGASNQDSGTPTTDASIDAGNNAGNDAGVDAGVKDPATAPKASIDRFSAEAGHLMVRDGSNGLPGANMPIDFDQAPFITRGLGPTGEHVRYYNFDVQPVSPAPIYVLFRAGESMPVAGQLNIIDVIPGDAGYNDFWQVHKVTVPSGYVANTVTSYEEIMTNGFSVESTSTLVNCPVVPEGSTATLRFGTGSSMLHTGWYKGNTVRYFTFEERALTGTVVPLSPIYVMFNVNPDQQDGGPASGFMTENGSAQTHNVVATVPNDAAYSPLWSVQVLDNAAFDGVSTLESATQATVLGVSVATVNCPVVVIEGSDEAAPTDDAGLLSFLEDGLYRRYPAEPAVHASTGPHGRVRTFLNDRLAQSLADEASSHPVGATSVKELFDGGDQLIGWAVLQKMAADSANGQGYFWYEYANGQKVISGNGLSACTGCHSAGRDYVRTPPL